VSQAEEKYFRERGDKEAIIAKCEEKEVMVLVDKRLRCSST
jgi:hypothetical protein